MKTKHGKSIEITDQLSEIAATTIAQWIGCSSVIYNQKTISSKKLYSEWLTTDKTTERPVVDQKVAHLTKTLPFLNEIPCQIRRNAGSQWYQAMTATLKGLRKAPKVKPKNKKRNCYVTNELFDVQDLDNNRCLIQIKKDATKQNRANYLCGIVMPFPKEDAGHALILSRKGNRFWLSMSYDIDLPVLTQEEIKQLVINLSDDELIKLSHGYDLGIIRQITSSDGTVYHINDECKNKLSKLETKKQRYQRRYARMARANDRTTGTKKRKRTNGERKILSKINKFYEKQAAIKFNNSHCISKKLAEETPLIAIFEDIKLNNMVRKPKPKKVNGKFVKNGRAAKRGLNKAILGANMGQIRSFAKYKLHDRGKLFITVPAQYSSQECSICGFVHKNNRKTQDKFLCLGCGFAANADDNASAVIKKRGIAFIRSEAFSKEETKRIKISAKRTKAHELASSGSGDNVRHQINDAVVSDALNQTLII